MVTPAMKPDDIPEDVWEVATITTRESIRMSFVDPLMPMIVTMTPYVARAIMAERDRCAKIADYYSGMPNAGLAVAADIRDGAAAIRQER